jgi:hypothetical protein
MLLRSALTVLVMIAVGGAATAQYPPKIPEIAPDCQHDLDLYWNRQRNNQYYSPPWMPPFPAMPGMISSPTNERLPELTPLTVNLPTEEESQPLEETRSSVPTSVDKAAEPASNRLGIILISLLGVTVLLGLSLIRRRPQA